MEQRVLRLGDLVDDYCPRERRVTDHVIVALVDDAIRQTRCAACESEHEYKEARMPRKKGKSDDAPALAGGVLVPKSTAGNGHADDVAVTPTGSITGPASHQPAQTPEPSNAHTAAASADQQSEQDGADDREPAVAWFGHRPLIRASLPKSENDVPPPRAIPEFTMHQRPGRGFGGRPFRHQGFGGSNNGNGPGREPDGNRAPGPGGPGGGGGGKGRHRRRHRRPR
jgi:hypothetical protein